MSLPRDPRKRKIVILAAGAVTSLVGLVILAMGGDRSAGAILILAGPAFTATWFLIRAAVIALKRQRGL